MAQASAKIEPFPKGVTVEFIKKLDKATPNIDELTPKKGDTLVVHYVGTFHGGKKHGKEFDSSRNRGNPFTFPIGQERVIRGWDEGMLQMKIGEKANLKISSDYGYEKGQTLFEGDRVCVRHCVFFLYVRYGEKGILSRDKEGIIDSENNKIYTIPRNQDLLFEVELLSIQKKK
ncbi:hypothetical protein RFI_07764 [Reticulomyxa filosa]|uniref:peptidylprolyl isomerase n=1 Tax=Reticulomyxa filosa TaxID=46433 RepID=X6NTS5_RETFI|nr:hypothetical protein RFI_07764 [Reticulomyxa filosa]|eukprot:ETO29358.1 hypothetical protein RFI_07764 [Reticulomyxa filosa]